MDGENVVYSQHVVSGMSGPMNLGHHAMLKFPDVPGSGRVSTSRFVYGQVFPEAFEFPEKGGYSWLKAGAEFSSLEKVPTLDGQTADLTRYPARRGFEDLVMLVSDAEQPFGWTAVAFPQAGLRVVRAEGPAHSARDGALDFQRRTALSALEQPACQCHGVGGGVLVFPFRVGGVGAAKSHLGQGVSHLRRAQPAQAVGGALHYGRGQDSARV